MISARVIADSVNPTGTRLTTVEATFNRYILAELNTHRVFSRNSASSRAIPVRKTMAQVWRDPAEPVSWGANQSGMQARSDLTGWRRWAARRLFLLARIPALILVWLLSRVGLHKQVANRILEPWVWHTAIVSSTEWMNFFKLRLHPDAQPEFQRLAQCIRAAIDSSTPRKLEWGEWHLPYVLPEDWAAVADADAIDPERDDKGSIVWPVYPEIALVGVARCAAVSYLRQNEQRSLAKDLHLVARLTKGGHWSPFEHVAIAEPDHKRDSNFDAGWKQLRKFFPEESGR